MTNTVIRGGIEFRETRGFSLEHRCLLHERKAWSHGPCAICGWQIKEHSAVFREKDLGLVLEVTKGGAKKDEENIVVTSIQVSPFTRKGGKEQGCLMTWCSVNRCVGGGGAGDVRDGRRLHL